MQYQNPKIYFINVALICFLCISIHSFSQNEPAQTWVQAQKWADTNGDFINAHGAGILKFNKKYYLYGEIKSGETKTVAGRGWDISRVPAGGIACYTSSDLKHWKNEEHIFCAYSLYQLACNSSG